VTDLVQLLVAGVAIGSIYAMTAIRALLGGLLVGLVETLSGAYISGPFRDAFALAILIAVLLLKLEALWGVKEEWSS
jgi:branched-chain amino acid transport system permease protein